MINKARHTKKFCVLGSVVEDLAKIHQYAKDNKASVIAVSSYNGTEPNIPHSGYEVRLLNSERLFDIIVYVGIGVHVHKTTTVVERECKECKETVDGLCWNHGGR